MKKIIIIPISLFFVLPFLIIAQEEQIKQEENPIFCAQFKLVVNGFEVSDAAKIYVCCGGPFSKPIIPCKILNKSNYESFSGQSNTVFNLDENGFLISELLVPLKNKIAKLKVVEVTDCSVAILGENKSITIKKGMYTITQEGMIFLEIEYLK